MHESSTQNRGFSLRAALKAIDPERFKSRYPDEAATQDVTDNDNDERDEGCAGNEQHEQTA